MTKTKTQLIIVADIALLFILLKFCKIIHWSWLWVLSPVWIPIASGIIVASIYFGFLKNKTGSKSKWQKRLDQINEESKNLVK